MVSPEDRRMLVMAGIMIGSLWALDTATTLWAVGRGAVELNFLPRLLLARGWGWFIAGKMTGFAALMSLAWRMTAQGNRKLTFRTLLGVGIASLGIVAWNSYYVLLILGLV